MGVRIHVDYLGDLQCKAQHGPSQNILLTDAPTDNQGRGEHFSPTDLLATSLVTCMVTTMGMAARTRGIDFAPVHADVEKEMGAKPRRHVAKLTVSITLPVKLSPQERELLEHAAHACPVHASLAPTTVVDLQFTYA